MNDERKIAALTAAQAERLQGAAGTILDIYREWAGVLPSDQQRGLAHALTNGAVMYAELQVGGRGAGGWALGIVSTDGERVPMTCLAVVNQPPAHTH